MEKQKTNTTAAADPYVMTTKKQVPRRGFAVGVKYGRVENPHLKIEMWGTRFIASAYDLHLITDYSL
jgi:hypothetical protein